MSGSSSVESDPDTPSGKRALANLGGNQYRLHQLQCDMLERYEVNRNLAKLACS